MVSVPVQPGQAWLQCVMVWLAVMVSFLAIDDTITSVVRRKRQ